MALALLMLLTVVAQILLAGPVKAAPAGVRHSAAHLGTPAAPAPRDGVWPLRPRPQVVARFDPPASRFGSGHRGVDLAGHTGQAVHAALPGRISFAGRLAGRGVVVVDHGGTRTTYEPVSATVRVGAHVAAGAVLGHLELFGSHCFPRACLHWGLIQGRAHYLDPLLLVGAVPVRLLPWSGGVLGALPDAAGVQSPPLGPLPPISPLLEPLVAGGEGLGSAYRAAW